jgi:hypothetical protein
VEAHFAENIPASCFFAPKTAKLMMITYSASWANSSATSSLPLADERAMSL